MFFFVVSFAHDCVLRDVLRTGPLHVHALCTHTTIPNLMRAVFYTCTICVECCATRNSNVQIIRYTYTHTHTLMRDTNMLLAHSSTKHTHKHTRTQEQALRAQTRRTLCTLAHSWRRYRQFTHLPCVHGVFYECVYTGLCIAHLLNWPVFCKYTYLCMRVCVCVFCCSIFSSCTLHFVSGSHVPNHVCQ